VHLLREKKIVWKERWYDPDSERFNITVVGVHCRIQEPMHETWSKNPKYYSHKNNTSGFNYEIAISVVEGHCCWINGPFPAGRNDMSIYNEPEGLKEKMRTCPGKRAIADLGYRGAEVGRTLSTPSSHYRNLLSNATARSNARGSTAPDDDTLTISGLSYSLQRQANSTYRIANGRRTHTYGSLVDSGANGGLAGSDVIRILLMVCHSVVNAPICRM
jgi:hypothetical protein